MIPVSTVDIPDSAAMVDLGRRLAGDLRAGDVVLLHGDLGAGKTTMTQGIALGLGIDELVQSPTFTLVAEHDGRDAAGMPLRLYHLDLYRLEDTEELEGIGYGQYLAPQGGVTVIEWPERGGTWLPERFWLVRISNLGEVGRRVSISRHSDHIRIPDE
jgi:tRNA threonylcarbamoyladenosine biosynthesis protein TsaE